MDATCVQCGDSKVVRDYTSRQQKMYIHDFVANLSTIFSESFVDVEYLTVPS